MPAKERRTGDSGGGDADQPLVCRRVLPKGVGESNQHGEIEGIHEGDNEKTKDRLGVRDGLKPRCQIRGGKQRHDYHHASHHEPRHAEVAVPTDSLG